MWWAAYLMHLLWFSCPNKKEATTKEISQTSYLSPLGRSHMYWDCLYLPLYIWMDIQGGSEVHLGHHPGFEEKASSLQPYSDNMPSQLPPVCSWSTQIFLSRAQPTHLNKDREERKKGDSFVEASDSKVLHSSLFQCQELQCKATNAGKIPSFE